MQQKKKVRLGTRPHRPMTPPSAVGEAVGGVLDKQKGSRAVQFSLLSRCVLQVFIRILIIINEALEGLPRGLADAV